MAALVTKNPTNTQTSKSPLACLPDALEKTYPSCSGGKTRLSTHYDTSHSTFSFKRDTTTGEMTISKRTVFEQLNGCTAGGDIDQVGAKEWKFVLSVDGKVKSSSFTADYSDNPFYRKAYKIDLQFAGKSISLLQRLRAKVLTSTLLDIYQRTYSGSLADQQFPIRT